MRAAQRTCKRSWTHINSPRVLESTLQSILLLAAPRLLPEVRLFRRNVGASKLHGHTVRFGIKGQCDLYALVRGGLHMELEIKTAEGQLSREQRLWRDFCLDMQIPWMLLKANPDEGAPAAAERWCREIESRYRTLGK
jgi:hypothetical protein